MDPATQVVIVMDGFGPPALKRESYRQFVVRQPVEFTGFNLFYEEDVPLIPVGSVLDLRPPTVVVICQ